MKRTDHLLLRPGASEQQFELCIPFLQVDGAHDSVQVSCGQRTTPDINGSPVAARRAFAEEQLRGWLAQIRRQCDPHE